MAQEGQPSHSRGRMAERPWEISLQGWRDIGLRLWHDISDNNIFIIAAGVAFYAFLSIFPALVAIVSIYGIVANPADIQQQFSNYSGMLPEAARTLLSQQLQRIASSPAPAMSAGVIVGSFFTLWSATQGTKAFIAALNIVYDEKEKRGFLQYNKLALLMTLGVILLIVFALILIVALPTVLNIISFPAAIATVISFFPWLLLAGVFIFGLSALYRYGPSRKEAQWYWVSPGSVVATVLWIAISVLFSFYVGNFGKYANTYGSLGAIIILLLWFYWSAFATLLGAALNAEMEHQTTIDTTKGQPKPMGKRGAYVADTIGKISNSKDE